MTSATPSELHGGEKQAVAAALRRMAGELLDLHSAVGIDVVDVSDFERLTIARHPAFYRRCFSDREIAYCCAQARPAQHFAVRFAAKEATVKALADRTRLGYWQIEVERHTDGRPALALWTCDRSARLAELPNLNLLVSLSHSEAWAAALVVAFDTDGARDG